VSDEISLSGVDTGPYCIINILTWGVGISEWEKLLLNERELTLFHLYREMGCDVWIVSTSAQDFKDKDRISKQYHDYNFVFLRPNLISSFFKLITDREVISLRQKYKKNSGKIAIRSNQLLGAHLGIAVRRFRPMEFIVRQGFNAVDSQIKSDSKKYTSLFFAIYEHVLFLFVKKWEFTSDSSMKSTLNRNRWSWSSIKPVVIPNFVDMKVWAGKPFIKKEFSKLRIGFFGRLAPEKNLTNLVEAFAIHSKIELILVGEGPNKVELQNLAESFNYPLVTLDRMSPQDLAEECNTWDYAIFPSLFEGNPKGVLEMFSLGIPVLATPVDGITQLVRDRETGFLSNGTAKEDLLELLRKVEEITPDIRASVVSNAKRFVEKNNSLGRFVKKEMAFYFNESSKRELNES
jgi:glycosyltransferase involved in cell wall biosynthesis